MKYKKEVSFVAVFICCTLVSVPANANSSWHWLTKTTPVTLLPLAVVLTLAVEYIAVKKINTLHASGKLFLVICLANLASFLLPFAMLLVPSEVGYTFEMSVNHLPIYIVGLGYLILTLVVEVPLVYRCLRRHAQQKKRLVYSIVASNVVTTIVVGTMERIVCRGQW